MIRTGVRIGRMRNVITDQFGHWNQDACTAGGAFCPQPESFGASLNPCCYSSPASSSPTVDEAGIAVPVVSTVGGVPAWGWAIGAAALAVFLISTAGPVSRR